MFADWLIRFSDYEQGDGDLNAFNRAMAAAEEGDTILFDRAADYNFSGTLQVTKSIGLWGGNPTNSTGGAQELRFANANTGIRVNDGALTTMQDMVVRSTNGTAGDFHGVHATAPIVMRNVFVRSFQGDGILLSGVAASGTTVVGSYLENCSVSLAGKSGYHLSGDLAHGCEVIGCSADNVGTRDIAGSDVGFLDESTSGNSYVMCHAALSSGFDYQCTGASARSSYLNCYSELPGTANISNPSVVFGGFMRGTITGGWLDPTSNGLDLSRTEWINLASLQPKFTAGSSVNDVLYEQASQTDDATGYYMMVVNAAGVVTYQMRHAGDAAKTAYSLTAAGGRGAGYLSTERLVARTVRVSSGTLAERPTTSTAGDTWAVGDLWFNSAYAAATPFFWKVSVVGGGGALTWVDGPNQP